MPLAIGSRLGSYEIVSPLGAGGMGEVYRARDTRLGRNVALKVLPDLFAGDPERVARFDREARTLAQLNHPNIAHIYGLEQTNGTTALVMEFVEGEDLARRLARGRLALDEALSIARQIAEALAAAHDQGIVHRDLKPANVSVRPDGTVKVLDFGLAKVLEDSAGVAHVSPALLNSPTITSSALTAQGIVLGTAAYMSPEQARGKPVDRRTDIWALGCVLYEMLSGRRPFEGGHVADAIVAVLTKEPDWSALAPDTPEAIRRVLRRCLQKDPARRLRDAAEIAIEIDDAEAGASVSGTIPATARLPLWKIGLIAGVLVLAAAVVAGLLLRRSPPVQPEARVEITTPPTTEPGSIAISPDGRTIAFAATDDGHTRLWLRPLDSTSAHPLPGTDGASHPFWAPHGRSLGFFTDDGRMKRIDLDDRRVRVLARAPLPRGGTWNGDDVILFVPMTGPVYRISASGERAAVTKLGDRQTSHTFPRFLPGGRHFLYYATGAPEARGIHVAALDGSPPRRLLDTDVVGVATSRGHLLFMRGTTLFAQPFDSTRLELYGTPFRVADSIGLPPVVSFQSAPVSASDAGHIVYRSGGVPHRRQFFWFDRSGREIRTVGAPDTGGPLSPALSPDGRLIAAHRNIEGNIDIWLLDTTRGGLTRFTTDPSNEVHPLWSPDGSRIVFASNRSGTYRLMVKAVGGTSEEKPLWAVAGLPIGWSRDGRFLLHEQRSPATDSDIWVLPLNGNGDVLPFRRTEFMERHGEFSPDGRWVAYASDESGRSEVYLQSFPKPGITVPVSINGGAQPRWRDDGKELFFIALDRKLMAVSVALPAGAGSPEVGTPLALFETRIGSAVQYASRQQYFASPDGQRFLMNVALDAPTTTPLTLIMNWRPAPAE